MIPTTDLLTNIPPYQCPATHEPTWFFVGIVTGIGFSILIGLIIWKWSYSQQEDKDEQS